MFDPRGFIEEKIGSLKEEVQDRETVVAVSGGVDSTTTAMLGHLALGERLHAVFLDDGLMREDEPRRVSVIFKHLGIEIEVRKLEQRFFSSLKGKTDPEEKRKAFRDTFYQCLGEVTKKIGARCLLQGTIAADVLETRRGVKTQHNVLEQIGIDSVEEYGFKVVEPLKELYKHEVRAVAKELGLPREVFERRPFPGPGLAIRVLGEVTPERIGRIRRVTAIVEEETVGTDCFQSFAVLMQDKATGLDLEGRRNYGEIVVVRIIDSVDAMTATPTEISWEKMKNMQRRIVGTVPSIVRVLYDISPKPPATIEFE
ncbi:MAG: 7-cyano-7-deazaguanine synthase [Candidatus Bathyarchaeota archaeon]|nr:MAG: 7-cyano-7-deazaguanine synthase [Candidatus Bathyarchaeota archaeon]